MRVLKELNIEAKLVISYVVIALLIVVVGVIGALSLKSVSSSSNTMYNNNLQAIYMMTDMKQNLTQIKSDILELIYVKTPSERASLEQDIDSQKTENDKYISTYGRMTKNSSESKEWVSFGNQLVQYNYAREDIINLVNNGRIDEAVQRYKGIVDIEKNMFNNLDKLINANLSDANSQNVHNSSLYETNNKIISIFVMIGFILAAGLGTLVSRGIKSSLLRMEQLAENMGDLDFTHKYKITKHDEFGKTYEALNKAQENIKDLIGTIIENSQNMNEASKGLNGAVEKLLLKSQHIDNEVNNISSGIEQISASSEEINASVEEIDSNANELSQKSTEASGNANKAKTKATNVKTQGKKSLEKTREVYSTKKESMLKAIESGKVVENIKVMAGTIDDIAEQTNLLALNAAIEAQRAGEQGKGFTVVAGEVAKLAEESKNAAAEIQDTISKVGEAFELCADNGRDILEFINGDVDKQLGQIGNIGNQYYEDSDFVSKMSEEIAAMSEELTATIGQVSEAVQSNTQNAQKSSESTQSIRSNVDDMAEALNQVSKAAQNQAEMAHKLDEVVKKFKI